MLPDVVDSERFEIRSVEQPAPLSLLPMTFPAYRGRLLKAQARGPISAWYAFGDRPLGMVLATTDETGRSAEILSIFVPQADRARGIGQALLAAAETDLRSRGVTQAWLTFCTGDHSTSVEALQRLLARSRWSEPREHMYLIKIENANHDRLLQAAWIRDRPWPDGVEIFPWLELSPSDRTAIQQRQSTTGWYPPSVSPFHDQERIEPLNSLGLRYQGEVRGWIVTHRIAADTIRYSNLFACPGLPHRGLGLRLLGEATRRQAQADTFVRYGIFGILADNPFAAIAERRCAPFLTVQSVSVTWRSSKQL